MKNKNYIEAPNEYNGEKSSIFLAGGITGCFNWQKEMIKKLEDLPVVIFNPRRESFTDKDFKLEEDQVKWEFKYIHKATCVSFWFSKETLNPITLLELGSQLSSSKKLFIGIHSDYEKKNNVIIQTKLARPEIEIVYSIEDLACQIKDWLKDK